VTVVGIHASIVHGGMKPMMGIGILVTGVGIVLVASNTPHGPGQKPSPKTAAAEMTAGADAHGHSSEPTGDESTRN